ncbi:hypothetical protein ACQ4LE_000472 [Meloidogyne hapla]
MVAALLTLLSGALYNGGLWFNGGSSTDAFVRGIIQWWLKNKCMDKNFSCHTQQCLIAQKMEAGIVVEVVHLLLSDSYWSSSSDNLAEESVWEKIVELMGIVHLRFL